MTYVDAAIEFEDPVSPKNIEDTMIVTKVFARYPGEAETLPGAFLLPGDNIDVNLSTAENKPPTKPTP